MDGLANVVFGCLAVAVSVVAMVGCVETERDSLNSPPEQRIVPVDKEPATPKPMVQHNRKPWRFDPILAGRFHPDYPDDLQVIVHDGGPRFTDKSPEVIWVTVTARHEEAYQGKALNQPHELKSVRQGDEILFLAVAGAEHPFQVSEKYLAERNDWLINPCNKCGFAELFDAPSDLIRKVFPRVGDTPHADMEAFTSYCPLCDGMQLIQKPGFDGPLK